MPKVKRVGALFSQFGSECEIHAIEILLTVWLRTFGYCSRFSS